MKRIFLLFGMLFGFWLFFSPGTLTVALLAAMTYCFIAKSAHGKSEKRFLASTFILAYILFSVVCVCNFYAAIILKNDSDLLGDASAYSCHGAYIAHVLSDGMININTNYIDLEELNLTKEVYDGKLPDYRKYRIGFFAYFYGMIYYFFGFSPLIVKFLNTLLGILSCFLIYFWMRDVFGYAQARISLMLTLFYPSRVLWAASGLKDTMVFTGFSVFLFIFYKLRKNNALFWYILFFLIVMFIKNTGLLIVPVLIGAAIFNAKKYIILLAEFLSLEIAYILIYWIRPYFIDPIMAVLAVSLSTMVSRNCLKRLIVFFIIIAPFAAAIVNRDVVKARINTHILELIGIQRTQAEAGEYAKSRYRIYPQRFYDQTVSLRSIPAITVKEFFESLLTGQAYLFLSPFPWSLKSRSLAIGYLLSVVIYLLLPFIIVGVIMGLRYHWRDTFLYVLMVIFVSPFLSLVLGNAGTLFRHRDVLMPFFISFAAIGIIQFSRGFNKVALSK